MTFDGRIEARMTVPAGVSVTATNAGGSATVFFPQGAYFPSTLISTFVSQLNSTSPLSATWTGSLSTGPTGTGQVTLNGGGTWSLTWTTAGTTLESILGFDVNGNILNAVTSQTGTKQCRGVWIPDCPLGIDADPRRAPKISDMRTTVSPTGAVLGLVGNFFYRQKRVRWTHVDISRTWEAATTIANSSWEFFFNGTQLGQDSSTWFSPVSPVTIYDTTGTALGTDKGISAWQITGITGIEPTRVDPTGWTGRWTIELPEIVSSG